MSALPIEPIDVITADAARTLTDRIKVAVEATWQLVTEAYQSRAWSALGYSSWDDYCTREFGTSRLRLPREERQEVVASLRESGLSIRAIAAATGDSYGTVRNALDAGEQICSPDDLAEAGSAPYEAPSAPAPRPVTGTDGKTYTRTKAIAAKAFADEKAEQQTKRQDAAEIQALMDELNPPDFDPAVDEVFIRERGRLRRLCRDIAETGDPADLYARHMDYAPDRFASLVESIEAAYSWLDALMCEIGNR